MKKFTACFINEFQKLTHRKKYLVFLLIGIGICILNILSKMLVARISSGMVNLTTANSSMSTFTLFIEYYIPLVTMMAVCDLFSTEYQDLTIKATLTRPITRFKIYLGKVCAVTALAVIYLAVIFVAANALELMINRRLSRLGYALGAYLMDIIPLFLVILLSALINQLGKGGTLAMFLCIVIYLALKIAGIFIPNLSGLLFTGYMQWHKLWLGHMLPPRAMISKVALLVGYGLIFFSGGYYLFLKREI